MCVRYRYDETTKERWKTVELIVEKSHWEPPPPRWRDATRVAIRVAAQEREVRKQVKAVGGKWNPSKVVWELPYGQVVALGLTGRVVITGDGGEKEVPLHRERSEREDPAVYR